jgi:hypothetical protein
MLVDDVDDLVPFQGAKVIRPTVPGLSCAIGDQRLRLLRSQTRGSACRAGASGTLRVSCANPGKSIPTQIGHTHRLDENIRRDMRGLVGYDAGRTKSVSTGATCHDLACRPPDVVWVN